MESLLCMMRMLQCLWQREKKKRKKKLRGCVTWKLATCFAAALNSELVGVFEEILMRTGVNRACMQSPFLQLVDATDHLSRRYTITQLWPACTWLGNTEDGKATGARDSHPMHRVKIKFLVDTRHGRYLFQCVILPVCFIFMPPRCQSDKTFATETVTVHVRQIRLPHCIWMIIQRHHVSHWFIFKESRHYFVLIALAL